MVSRATRLGTALTSPYSGRPARPRPRVGGPGPACTGDASLVGALLASVHTNSGAGLPSRSRTESRPAGLSASVARGRPTPRGRSSDAGGYLLAEEEASPGAPPVPRPPRTARLRPFYAQVLPAGPSQRPRMRDPRLEESCSPRAGEAPESQWEEDT